MKTLITILIIASFIQATVLPINLVIIILICRAYIGTERSNLYLAFGFGLLISHLNIHQLGLQSIIYLVLVQLTHMLSKSKITANYLFIIPISFVLLLINNVSISIFTHQTINYWPQVLIESLLSLPILFLIRLWEERFVVRKEIKLRI